MGKICRMLSIGRVCLMVAVLALALLLPAASFAVSLNIGSSILKGGSSYSIECDTGGYGQAALYYSIDGGPEVLIHDGPASDVDPSFDWTPPSLDTTNCVIRLDAYDFVYGDGQQALHGPITIDSTGPQFTALSVGGGAPHYAKLGDPVMITFTASELLAASPQVKVNGHNAFFITNNVGHYAYSYIVGSGDDDGYATITIYGADMAGNEYTESNSSALFIDKTSPSVVACSAPSAGKSGAVSIDFEVTDPNGAAASGIRQVSLWYSKDGAGWVDSGLAPISAASGTFDYTATEGSYVFGVVAEDNAANSSANPPTVTSNTAYDATPPSITAPDDVNANTDAGQSYASGLALGNPTVSDSGSGIAGAATNDAPAHFGKGVTAVTWTVSDKAGNIARATQKVTVTDNEKPSITAPTAVNANTDAGKAYATITAAALGVPTVSDNCPGVTSASDALASNQYPKGTTIVTWTATDASGNTKTATQSVTVTDSEKPTITAPANITVRVDAGKTYATILPAALGTPVVSDNCLGVTSSNNAPASNQYPKGVTTVTWTATDASGNTKTATQTITVQEAPMPNAGKASSPKYENAVPTVHPIVVTYTGAGDNCDSRTVHLWVKKYGGQWTDTNLTSTTSSGSFNYTGMTGHSRYYFALRTEAYGNVSAMPAGDGDTNTVYDLNRPVVKSLAVTGSPAKLKAAVTITFTSSESLGQMPTVTVNGNPAAKTGITGLTYTYVYRVLATDPDGPAVVNVSLVDLAGNTGTASTTITIDKTAPDVATVVSSDDNYVFFKGSRTATIGWNCHDALTGVASVYLRVSSDNGVTWTTYGPALQNPYASGSSQIDLTALPVSDTYRFKIVATDKAGNIIAGPASKLYAIYDETELRPTVQIVSPVSGSYVAAGTTVNLKAIVTMPVFRDPRTPSRAYKESDPSYWFANINAIQPMLREYKKNSYGAPASKPAVKTLVALGAAQRKCRCDAIVSTGTSASGKFLTKAVTFQWEQSFTMSASVIGSANDVFQLEVPYASVLSRANTKPADKPDPGAAVRDKEPLMGDSDANYDLLRREYTRFWIR